MEFLNTLGQSVAAFIFVLGVMIFIHELGHHLAAKWLGIRVETFSLGFGPRLFGFRMGGTDYRVSLLPLGGYVKMAGENVTDELTGSPDEFLTRPKRQRFLVAIAGPLMNISLAIVLLAVYFMLGVRVATFMESPVRIGAVVEDSAAQKAGLQVGDVITAIDGDPVDDWQEAQLRILTNANQLLAFTYQRGGRAFDEEILVDSVGSSEEGSIGIYPFIPFVIDSLSDGFPAQEAGLRSGDEITQASVGDERAEGFYAISMLVARQAGIPVTFSVRRDGEGFPLEITPKAAEDRAMIGASPRIESRLEKLGVLEALSRSVERNYTMTVLLFDILGRIITGQTSFNQLGGPIEIARISGLAASQGAMALMHFMSFISLQLGILNLLPIPILDGGVITLLAIEGLIRRELSLKFKERVLQAGFIFLVLLMSFVIYNDIAKLL